MKSDKVLLLGDPWLHEVSEPVNKEELAELQPVIQDLHEILFEFKAQFSHYGAFRAIAAPQIGVMKRLIYLYIDQPVVFINPQFTYMSEERMEVWDDCMCFPNLLVKLQRHQSCTIEFLDLSWQPQTLHLEGSLSELLQHEYDHLDGVLATQRAMDAQSFRWRK